MRHFRSLLFIAVCLLFTGCIPKTTIDFVKPLEGQLSLAGEVPALIFVPEAYRDSLVITLDGVDVTDLFNGGSAAQLPSPAGEHELVASFSIMGIPVSTTRNYETVNFTEPGACDALTEAECQALSASVAAECNLFNMAECLLPYPSNFLTEPAATATGIQLAIPQQGMPEVNGPTQVPASMINSVDGFSPTVQILTHFPEGVDVAASGLSRLLPPCLVPAPPDQDPECVPNTGPPYDDFVRTHDARSLDPDHPTVLIGPGGERILHWTENDVPAQETGRQAFIIHPAVSLIPGKRYFVAIRNLVDADGNPVEASPAFAAMRDRRPTDVPQLVDREVEMEQIFKTLQKNKIDRSELILAFDFTVQSDDQLTRQMLSMRDQGLAWLETQAQPTFTVDAANIEENDCSDPDEKIWKVVPGRYAVPLFLSGPPNNFNVGQHTVDANDIPVQNGVWSPFDAPTPLDPTPGAPYHVSLPCLLHPEYGDPEAATHTLLLGHGIFGTGRSMVRGIPPGASDLMDFWRTQGRDTREWNYVAGATDWSGWSSPDFPWVGGAIIGIGTSSLHQFPAFPDRHRQGQLNTLILSRMMKRGLFNSHPEFQDGDGNGLLPVPEDDPDSGHYYYGISMGGVQGLFHAAISTDIEKFGIDVGSMNFSFLLPRSTQFNTVNPNDIDFRTLLASVGLGDDLDVLIGVQLLHELWVSGDPAGYMTHVTQPWNLLPGNDFPKKLYMSPAWLDYQVSNHGTEITTRTLGVTSGPGSVQKGLVGIADEAPGTALDSALVMWDTGRHDILDPTTQDQFPPLRPQVVQDPAGDPHGFRPFIPATVQTLMTFLQPGGQIENFCDDNGICDASEAWECNGSHCPSP